MSYRARLDRPKRNTTKKPPPPTSGVADTAQAKSAETTRRLTSVQEKLSLRGPYRPGQITRTPTFQTSSRGGMWKLLSPSAPCARLAFLVRTLILLAAFFTVGIVTVTFGPEVGLSAQQETTVLASVTLVAGAIQLIWMVQRTRAAGVPFLLFAGITLAVFVIEPVLGGLPLFLLFLLPDGVFSRVRYAEIVSR